MRDSKKQTMDLHIHTGASDGTWEPIELVNEAKKQKLRLIAVTDHNSVEYVDASREFCEKEGIAFLPGVEINSSFKGEWFHILGYGCNHESQSLKELMRETNGILERIGDAPVRFLIDEKGLFSHEEYDAYQRPRHRGGWKSLVFLLDKGWCEDFFDYHRKVTSYGFETGGMSQEFVEPERIIRTIQEAGGKAILAHPCYDKRDTPLTDTLEFFKELGISGVECSHPHHNAEQINFLRKWCRENRLMSTAGSDCHGAFVPNRKLGKPEALIRDFCIDDLLPFISGNVEGLF